MKFKHYWQLEKKDCGPTCLRMICKYYDKEMSIGQVRSLCETTKLGTTVLDLKVASEKLGFKASLGRGEAGSLTNTILPVILCWHPAHFVVLYAIKEKKDKRVYYIADPAFGKIKLLEEVFIKRWEKDGQGIVLILEPTIKFSELEIVNEDNKKGTYSQLREMYQSHIKNNSKRITFAMILTLVGMVCSWLLPFFLQYIIDLGITGNDISIVLWIVLVQFVVTLGHFIARTFSSILLMKTNLKIGIEILSSYLHKIIRLPIAIFDRKQSSDFIIKLNDISRIQDYMSSSGISLFLLIVNIVVFSSLLLYFNPIIFFIVVGLISIGLIWTTFFLRKRKSLDYELTRLQTENNLTIQEMINEMSEIKANNAQVTKVEQWSGIYKEQSKILIESLYLNTWQTSGAHMFSLLSNLGATAFCAYFVINDQMTLGIMMSICFIVSQLTVPIEQLVYLIRGLQDVAISNERIQEIHRVKDENENRSQVFNDIKYGIRLNNLSFRYLGTNSPLVLKNINLDIPKNSITAIVGVSGSGKTTLLKLLLGFYSPSNGSICIDGINLKDINLEDFRNEIGVVMQNGHIFSNSIIENIAMSDLAPDLNRVELVAKIACMHDFILTLPQKYKTRIGKNGIELSGGQKQRILIARALYKNPQILILDEATSALDANTERMIVENLNAAMKNKTVVIIAHRFSTIKAADQIVVLDNGEIAEIGDHKLLVSSNGEYFRLVKNQLDLN